MQKGCREARSVAEWSSVTREASCERSDSASAAILQLSRRLLRDETAVTSTEYIVAALAVALGAVVASRVVAGALVNYLHRIYVVVTLPIP